MPAGLLADIQYSTVLLYCWLLVALTAPVLWWRYSYLLYLGLPKKKSFYFFSIIWANLQVNQTYSEWHSAIYSSFWDFYFFLAVTVCCEYSTLSSVGLLVEIYGRNWNMSSEINLAFYTCVSYCIFHCFSLVAMPPQCFSIILCHQLFCDEAEETLRHEHKWNHLSVKWL